MFGLPAGSEMQIGLVAQEPGSQRRCILVVRGKFLQSVEGFLIDQEPLFDPTFQSAGGTDASETLFAIQHLHAISVLHVAHAVKDGGHLVAQSRLRGRDIRHLEHAVPPVIAGRQQEHGGQHRRHSQPSNPG